jgi:hypothetical protein
MGARYAIVNLLGNVKKAPTENVVLGLRKVDLSEALTES